MPISTPTDRRRLSRSAPPPRASVTPSGRARRIAARPAGLPTTSWTTTRRRTARPATAGDGAARARRDLAVARLEQVQLALRRVLDGHRIATREAGVAEAVAL